VIIQSEALNKSFRRHDALRGISLAVPEGSIYATVFLSSHELDEIEGSTTYVGYLENGRLLFQESMAELSDHVREVRVTLGHDAQIPQGSPGTWISFSLMGNGLSFVDAYSKGYASGRLSARSLGSVPMERPPPGRCGSRPPWASCPHPTELFM